MDVSCSEWMLHEVNGCYNEVNGCYNEVNRYQMKKADATSRESQNGYYSTNEVNRFYRTKTDVI